MAPDRDARAAGPCASVVIPVRNAREDLEKCLESLAEQTLPPGELEIIVVDDGSDDGTPGMAEARGIRVLRRDRGGASSARNAGAREAKGEFVLFLDADCVADPGWAEALLRPLRADSTLAGTVGRYESRQTAAVARYVQVELEMRYERMLASSVVDFLNSGCCAVRRDLLLRFPFDESYQRLEDVELSFRLAAAGHPLRFAPEAFALHRHPERLSLLLRRKFNYARYSLRLYQQYPGKAVSDSSTPHARRWRLVLLAVAIASATLSPLIPMLLWVSAFAVAGSVLLSVGTLRRGFAVSAGFGFSATAYLLLGNLAFLSGTARGLLSGRPPEAN